VTERNAGHGASPTPCRHSGSTVWEVADPCSIPPRSIAASAREYASLVRLLGRRRMGWRAALASNEPPSRTLRVVDSPCRCTH
jgi:hypothetical protein